MNIIRGKITAPVRALIYGSEGIGKTTFASQMPNPLFIDIENGSSQYDVARTDRPTSWHMLLAIVEELTKNAEGFKTLVFDTADWADKLCQQFVCDRANKTGIEEFGYGKGWVYVSEQWKKLLDMLTTLQEKQGIHVAFLAHSIMRKFELPEEAGAFDRWELKTEKRTASLLKEWADLMLFANYETVVVTTDDGKRKGQGGKRVMYATHHPCWDAKNRYGLPEKMPFLFESIGYVFESAPAPAVTTAATATVTPAQEKKEELKAEPQTTEGKPEYIPAALWDLMTMSGAAEADVQAAVEARGYYPAGTPISAYKPEFVNGVLVGAWEKVLNVINEIKGNK